MPERILVSSSNTGPWNYTFPINPYIYNAADKADISKVDVLHGPDISQGSYFDSRPRVLTWMGFEVGYANMDEIVDYFRSIEGEIRWFDFQDLDPINDRWDTTYLSSASWKKARVISLDIKYAKGGKLKYEKVDLTIIPEI